MAENEQARFKALGYGFNSSTKAAGAADDNRPTTVYVESDLFPKPRSPEEIEFCDERAKTIFREKIIAQEYKKIVERRVAECFRTEGVNSNVRCKELREQYWAICNDRFHGQLFPPDAQPRTRKVPGLSKLENRRIRKIVV